VGSNVLFNNSSQSSVVDPTLTIIKSSKNVKKTNMFVAFYVQLKGLSTVKNIYCSELNGA
jgi:hypothetical protein